MDTIKNLLFSSVILTQAFFSNTSFCAELSSSSSDEEPFTLAQLEGEGNTGIVNLTNIGLFISLLSATNGNTTPIFERKLPPMSFTTVILDEEERSQNITLSILATPKRQSKKQSIDYHSEDLIKKSITLLLQPKSIAGLAEIKLEIEDGELIAYLNYDFTNSSACDICQKKFENPANIAILGCGHAMHQECITSGASISDYFTKCPICKNPINQEDLMFKLARSKIKLVLCPISRLIPHKTRTHKTLKASEPRANTSTNK